MAQAPDPLYLGPYEDYKGPYFIRISIYFVQSSSDPWTQSVNLSDRAAGILNRLNSVYNAYNIYFLPHSSHCNTSGYQLIESNSFVSSQLDADAINIFDRGGTLGSNGNSYHIPNTYIDLSGIESGTNIPAGQGVTVVHEMGHCLGLAHIFAGTDAMHGECLETQSGCTNGDPACWCCGDYVCDTPITPPGTINATNDCSASIPAGVDPAIFTNIMAYTNPLSCMTNFTPEQIKRMWTYLAKAPILQGVQVLEKNIFTAVSTSSWGTGITSGNIVVETGGVLTVDNDVSMLRGSVIRVKKGGQLKVTATLTGACGKMWRGIVVEGDYWLPQTGANHGIVTVTSTGKIEHAEVGIDAENVDMWGNPIPLKGSGIIKVTGGYLENNTIGIRFGRYIYQSNGQSISNISQLVLPHFAITDDYRGTMPPVFLDLNEIAGLRINYGYFRDLRSTCTALSSRAVGINAKNAGFHVSGAEFKNLYEGVWADQLTETTGGFSVSGCAFSACFRGLVSLSNSGFSVTGNDFIVKKPAGCTLSVTDQVIGAQIRGNTPGFLFSDNNFSFDEPVETEDLLIGTDCQNTMEGLMNTIMRNGYTNLTIGNRALGINSGIADGLVYLCNTNDNSLSAMLPVDLKVDGTVKGVQSGSGPGGSLRPTGNVFSDFGYTFVNNGAPVTYYYYKNSTANREDPNVGLGYNGINPEELLQPNETCTEPTPCTQCPEPDVDAWKTRFGNNQADWLTQKAVLPTLTDPNDMAATSAAITSLRLSLNGDGGRILEHYRQDTTQIITDSIQTWLQKIGTYQTDLRLARHYFFAGNETAFDSLWQQTDSNYELNDAAQTIFDRLDDLYNLLREDFQSGYTVYNLPPSTLELLVSVTASGCDEAAYLSEAILRRNGITSEPFCETTAERRTTSARRNSVERSGLPTIKIYPNPAGDAVTLEYPGAQPGDKILITDLYGHTVVTLTGTDTTGPANIYIGTLPAGLYAIRIVTTNEPVSGASFLIKL